MTQAVPADMRGFIPHLVCANAAAAIEFYRAAFGAQEQGRLAAPDGRLMHAGLRVHGSVLMLQDEMPEYGALGPKALRGTPVTMHVYVEDVDAAVARAVAAGARVLMPAADMFWGDRYAKLEDPFGHHWSIATHLRDVPMAEMAEAMRRMPPPEAHPTGD